MVSLHPIMAKSADLDPRHILNKSGYKATKGRTCILEVLINEKGPITVAEISKKLGRNKVDEVTLYRALEALVSSGILRKVDLQRGNARYYEFVETHHHHFVCSDCGAIESFSDKLCEKIVKNALKNSNIFKKADTHSLEIFGICSKCAKQNR